MIKTQNEIPEQLFSDAYIELGDKESENLIAVETIAFFQQPLTYFKKHKNEFMYLESNSFQDISVDAVSIEVDDVFDTYDVMLGLKLQKKFATPIKEYLTKELIGEAPAYDLIFNQQDGLWDLNFALNYVEGFNEDSNIGFAYNLIYKFISNLNKSIKGK